MPQIIENLVSIIVPIYNSEKYLKRCVDVLIDQTYTNIEILLIDDESKDSSLKIAKNYQQKDNRVKVISKKHSGLSATRNIGIEEAKGEYLTFVDSDDYISISYVSLLYELIKSHNADIAMTHFVKGDKEKFCFRDEFGKVSVYSNIEFIENKLIKGDSQSACCKLYKWKIFENLRFPEGLNWEDLAISAEVFYNANLIVEMENELYYYYKNVSGIIHSKFDKSKVQAVYAYEKRLLFLENQKLDVAYQRFFRQYAAILFQYYYLVKKNFSSEKEISCEMSWKIKNLYTKMDKLENISVILKIFVIIGKNFPYVVGFVLNQII